MAKKTDQRTFQAKLDDFVGRLKADIAAQTYRHGTFLPSESTLSKQFDLSNRSIRQGLEQLAKEGLIEKIPRVGNRVNARKVIRVVYRNSIYRDVDFDRLLGLFRERNPDIDVQLIRTGLFPSFAEGMKPFLERERVDVVILNHFDFCDMAESGCLHLLDRVEPEPMVAPMLNEAFRAEDGQYASPFLFSPVILCYNTDHFREAGVPEPDSSWTWDDVCDAAAKLSDGGNRFGFFYHLFSINRWLVFLLQNGIKFTLRPDGGYDVDLPRLMKCFRMSRELLFKSGGLTGYPFETEEEVLQLFREGRSSMFLATYFSLNELKNDDVAFDISPLPRGVSDRTLLLLVGWAVNKASEQKEAAHRFVRFLSSPDIQELVQYSSMSLPAAKLKFDPERDECKRRRPQRFHLHREIIPSFRLHTELRLPLDRLYGLRNILKFYWSGIKDEEAVKAEIARLLEPNYTGRTQA